mgnify:CR=1 FL=1
MTVRLWPGAPRDHRAIGKTIGEGMSEINIWVNDRELKARSGQTILQAADEAGIVIPRLCYNPALAPSGSCRV